MALNVRRSHVVRVMVVVYAVFGFSLLYFLFFNTGLKLNPVSDAQGGQIVVLNDSVHAIRDITVVYLKNNLQNPIGEIQLLLPHESKTFPLLPEMADPNGSIMVLASAPFHLSTRSIVNTGNQGEGLLSSFQFSYPEFGYVGEPIEAVVNGCNTGSAPLALSVGLEIAAHPEWQPEVMDWSVSPNDCSSTQISFTATEPVSDLLIKIRVFSPWRTLGEGVHSVNILAPALQEETNPVPEINASG